MRKAREAMQAIGKNKKKQRMEKGKKNHALFKTGTQGGRAPCLLWGVCCTVFDPLSE